MAETLAFAFGSSNPIAGLHLVSQALPDCGPRQVAVQFLAVPVNPLDFSVIEGKYPVKLQSVYENEAGETLAIPGSDGAARIIQAGSAVNNLGVGDIVILRTHCRGTWRTQAVFDEDDLIRIPSTIDPRLASLLRMGGPLHISCCGSITGLSLATGSFRTRLQARSAILSANWLH